MTTTITTNNKQRYDVWHCVAYWLGNECLAMNVTKNQAEKIIDNENKKGYTRIDIWMHEHNGKEI